MVLVIVEVVVSDEVVVLDAVPCVVVVVGWISVVVGTTVFCLKDRVVRNLRIIK